MTTAAASKFYRTMKIASLTGPIFYFDNSASNQTYQLSSRNRQFRRIAADLRAWIKTRPSTNSIAAPTRTLHHYHHRSSANSSERMFGKASRATMNYEGSDCFTTTLSPILNNDIMQSAFEFCGTMKILPRLPWIFLWDV